jgi:hypothetical protein
MNHNIFLLGLFFPLLCNCSAPAEQTDTTNGGIFLTDSLKQVVTIDTVSIQEVTMELTLNGRVTFNQEQVARVYPIFGGTVTEVHAETGDYVQKGEVLAVIRSGEVADYEKQQKDAAQQVLTARRAMDATQDMYVSGIASERDMLQAKQELAAAEAEDKRVKEVFSIYHLLGNSFYQVKSPVAGFIINKLMHTFLLFRIVIQSIINQQNIFVKNLIASGNTGTEIAFLIRPLVNLHLFHLKTAVAVYRYHIILPILKNQRMRVYPCHPFLGCLASHLYIGKHTRLQQIIPIL